MMAKNVLLDIPNILRISNVSEPINTATEIDFTSTINQTESSITIYSNISLAVCFGFVLLILTTVIGNTFVILVLFLDKRLHLPSFLLIANMAIADLLLGRMILRRYLSM